MKKIITFAILGTIFGIVLAKSEAVSWYRTHEMFRFESIHMFGVIGVAVIFGAIFMMIMKKYEIKTLDGNLVKYSKKLNLNVTRHLIAGTIYGLGWALASCPGPMFTLVGQGYLIFLIVIVSASVGTYAYGAVQDKLPH